jgi:alpha-aminoadipic semialdehyde synthase
VEKKRVTRNAQNQTQKKSQPKSHAYPSHKKIHMAMKEFGKKRKVLTESSDAVTVTSYAGSGPLHAVGILAESKNPWERRAPLTPAHVRELVTMKVPVYVEASQTRAFSDAAYREAGATIVESIYDPRYNVDVVLGLKQIPVQRVPHDGRPRTYCFFSHTFKQQIANQGRFAAYADAGMTLLDYELIMKPDNSRERAMKFGPYAGLAGTIDGLHALGRLLLDRGFATPFLYISPAWQYRTIEEAFAAIRRAGDDIRRDGLPVAISPLVFLFTSEGDASTGARLVFEHLPYRVVEPKDLATTVAEGDRHALIVSVATHKHMVERVDGHEFDKAAYYTATDEQIAREYRSIFARNYLPYVSVLINCMFWKPKFPRLVTAAEAPECCTRLLELVDVACDPGGPVQFFVTDVPINRPFYTVRLPEFRVEWESIGSPRTLPDGYAWKSIHEGFPDPAKDGAGAVLVYGVDHIPAETPIDASHFFGEELCKYVSKYLVHHDPTLTTFPCADLPDNVNAAIELYRGALTPGFAHTAPQPERDLTAYLAGGHSAAWAARNAADFH